MHEDIKRRDLPKAALLVRKIGILSLVSMSLLIPRISTNLSATESSFRVSVSMLWFVSKVGKFPSNGCGAKKPKQMMHVESLTSDRGGGRPFALCVF